MPSNCSWRSNGFCKSELTHEEKKMAMEIRTIRQIIDYVELMAKKREHR